MIEMIVVALVSLAIGFGISSHLNDKKLIKLLKSHTEELQKVHRSSFGYGWDAGMVHGRKEEALDRILKRKPQE